MAAKAHPDCPGCSCWRPGPGEEMRVYVNGRLMREGETRTVTSFDRIEYVFVDAPDAPGRAGETQED
jgi:hypothetical protein